MLVGGNPTFVGENQDRTGTGMGQQQNESGSREHSLMSESIEHGNRSRYLAANAVRDLQHGHRFAAETAMDMAAMERHLQYEKWDTAEIAWRALRECWLPRG